VRTPRPGRPKRAVRLSERAELHAEARQECLESQVVLRVPVITKTTLGLPAQGGRFDGATRSTLPGCPCMLAKTGAKRPAPPCSAGEDMPPEGRNSATPKEHNAPAVKLCARRIHRSRQAPGLSSLAAAP
jgi:hypothetical protein